MAFITTEEVKEIRNNIKKAFPAKEGWKFSITKEHYSKVNLYIMEAPYGITKQVKGYESVNHFYIESSKDYSDRKKTDLMKMYAILSANHWDESDIMTDYFHCAYYMSMGIGKWDKAFKISDKVKKGEN